MMIHYKVVLKSAMMVCGELCAMKCGAVMMQQWYAGSWDTPVQVCC